MITIDRMKSLEDLKYEDYETVENYQEGKNRAIAYFKEIHESNNADDEWRDDLVEFYGPKMFQHYDDGRNVTVKTYVYESYVDSGSTDYFFFSYEDEF